MKKVLLFLLLITCVINVKAYENEYFSLDIPEGYNESIKDNTYKWTKDNNYIAITINNNDNKYDIAKYTDEDLNEQKQHLVDSYSSNLKDYKVEVSVSDMKRNTINDYSILTYDLYWNSKDYTGYDMYQKGAVYTTNNYIYTIIVSSDSEIKDDDFIKTLNNFKLKDSPIVYKSRLLHFIIVAGVLLGIIGFFIDFKKKKEHK